MLDLSISLSLSLQLPLFIHLFTHSYHQSVCVEHLPCTRPWAGYCLAVPVQIHFTLFPALFCVQEAHHHGLCHPGSLELCRLPAGNLEVEGEEVGQFTLSCCSLPGPACGRQPLLCGTQLQLSGCVGHSSLLLPHEAWGTGFPGGTSPCPAGSLSPAAFPCMVPLLSALPVLS